MKKRKHKKRKIHISLMESLTFGIFLLALLTFVFTFCKQLYTAKATLVLWSGCRVALLICFNGQPLVPHGYAMGGCFFISIIQHILGLIARVFLMIVCLALFPQSNIFQCLTLLVCKVWRLSLSVLLRYIRKRIFRSLRVERTVQLYQVFFIPKDRREYAVLHRIFGKGILFFHCFLFWLFLNYSTLHNITPVPAYA